MTEQLAFERGGPERVLTTYPLLAELLAEMAGGAHAALRAEVGRLAARLAVLRRLCVRVAEHLDAGRSPIQEAATCKLLGNAFERDVLELARRAAPTASASLRRSVAETLLAAPGFSLRGGASEVLLSIIVKQETT